MIVFYRTEPTYKFSFETKHPSYTGLLLFPINIVPFQDSHFGGNYYKYPQGNIDQNLNFNDFIGTIDDAYPNEDAENFGKTIRHSNNRDPRNKDVANDNETKVNSTKTKKKNLSDGLTGMYDPKNMRSAKNRLLHDLDHLPDDILKDTFVKNEERRLRKSRFQLRDVGTHYDKEKEKQEIQKTIQDELKSMSNHYTLWDIESEREMKDKDTTKYRGKRKTNFVVSNTYRVTSVGELFQNCETNHICYMFHSRCSDGFS